MLGRILEQMGFGLHELELEWLKYRHQGMAGFPESLAAGLEGKGFISFVFRRGLNQGGR